MVNRINRILLTETDMHEETNIVMSNYYLRRLVLLFGSSQGEYQIKNYSLLFFEPISSNNITNVLASPPIEFRLNESQIKIICESRRTKLGK